MELDDRESKVQPDMQTSGASARHDVAALHPAVGLNAMDDTAAVLQLCGRDEEKSDRQKLIDKRD